MFHVSALNVLALNCWGMPAKVGSEDKELRVAGIAEMIVKAEYDVYLLSELWMRPDHETIRAKVESHGFFMSAVGDFALSTCDGRVLPSFCSGLAIVSKYPFIEVSPRAWSSSQILKMNNCFRSSFLSILTMVTSPREMESTGRGKGLAELALLLIHHLLLTCL